MAALHGLKNVRRVLLGTGPSKIPLMANTGLPPLRSSQQNLENIGNSIDRVTTVDLRLSRYSRPTIVLLYEAARRAQHGKSLSMRAAKALKGGIRPGDFIFIVTGAGVADFLPHGETDGPPGGAALALAISLGLGGVPVFLTEDAYAQNVAQTVLGAGLGLRTPPVARRVPYTASVISLTTDGSTEVQAKRLFQDYQPKAVVVIERLGVNRKGVAHTATGRPVGSGRANVETLVELARKQGVLTVGVGDYGNEVGFGLIEEEVRKISRYGDRCQCECEDGVAAHTATDILIPASTSNWGAYGIAAALAAVVGRVDVLQNPDGGRHTIEASVASGAADGTTGRHIPLVDGSSLETQVSILTLLRTLVINSLSRPSPRPF